MHMPIEDPNVSALGSSCILACSGISKEYEGKPVISKVGISCSAGSFTSIIGPSGCGKSTLLAILGGLDTNYGGEVLIRGVELSRSFDSDLDAYRSREVGFVFQDFNLIDHLSAVRNVSLALEIEGVPYSQAMKRAEEALDRVGLADKLASFPNQLSGGEAQRVALARAIAKHPSIILADEPTGSLDETAAHQIARHLKQLAEQGACVIVVTHDTRLFTPLSDQVIDLASFANKGRSSTESAVKGEQEDASPGAADLTQHEEEGVPEQYLEKDRGKTQARDKNRRSAFPGHSAMPIKAVARVAISHLHFRLKRVIAAVMVCAVGMLGFGLLLSLVFGFGEYAGDLESRLLTNIPLKVADDISVDAVNKSSVEQVKDTQEIEADGSLEGIVDQAVLAESDSSLSGLVALLENMKTTNEDIQSIQAIYPLTNDLYVKSNGTWRFVDRATLYEDMLESTGGSSVVAESLLYKLPEARSFFRALISNDYEDLAGTYEVISGTLPTSSDEVVVVTRPDGTLGDALLALLGYVDTQALLEGIETDLDRQGAQNDMNARVGSTDPASYSESVSVEELLNLDLVLIEQCDYRVETEDGWVNTWYARELLDRAVAQATKLKVVGVVAPKYTMDSAYDPGYIGYLPELTSVLIAHANESAAVKAQRENPDFNIETNEPFLQEKDLAAKLLSQVDTSGIEDRKLEYLLGMTDVRVRMLLKSQDIDERGIDSYSRADIEDWLARAKDASYDEFVSSIESVAPLTLDGGVGAIVSEYDAYGTESIQEVLVYVSSLSCRQEVIDKIGQYNDLCHENGYMGVSIQPSGEMEIFEQAMQIMSLVVLAFAALSVLVIFVSVSSTMSTFVAERVREIGCLHSLGMGRANIAVMFLMEAVAMGFVSSLIAAVFVGVIVLLLNGRVEEILSGATIFKYGLSLVLAMVVSSGILCALAGSIPARNASRKDPIAALRS